MAEDEESDWAGYDSGPFCQHWSDPSDCERPCVCGHPCWMHRGDDSCRECDCEKFADLD